MTDGEVGPTGPGVLALPVVAPGLAPILQAAPAAALAAAWADVTGTPAFRGFAGPWQGARGSAIVRNSALLS